jgi:hypothetical protein
MILPHDIINAPWPQAIRQRPWGVIFMTGGLEQIDHQRTTNC